MLDISELEKKWSKYHFKKVLPYYLFSAVVITSSAIALYYISTNPNILNLQSKAPSSIKTTSLQTKVAVANQNEVIYHYKQNIFVPSYQFLTTVQTEYIQYSNAKKLAEIALLAKEKKKKRKIANARKKRKTKKRPVHKKPKPSKQAKVMSTLPPPTAQVIDATKEPKLTQKSALFKISSTSTSDDEINSIIKRFNKKKKPALSLFIAKKYYAKSNYTGAKKYAFETIKLNRNIDDANTIYAKSLVKLGQTNKAVKHLTTYIQQSHSKKAKALLNAINQGTFK